MKRFLILISLPCLFLGCNKPEEKGKPSVPVIDFKKSIKTQFVQLRDIAKRVEYVELESGKEAFIGEISKMVFTEKYIVILDRRIQKVLLFDSNGHFLRTIGKKGNNHEEYVMVFDIEIDNEEKCIYIYAAIDKILKYTFDNQFIKSIPTKSAKIINFEVVDDNIVFAVAYPMSIKFGRFSFGIMDSLGKVTKKLLHRQQTKRDDPNVAICNLDFYSIHDTIVYWEYIYDTIYSITPELTLIPRWVLNYGENAVQREAFKNRVSLNSSISSGNFIIENLVESRDHIFILAIENRLRQIFIYNKTNHRLINVQSHKAIFHGLYNNLDYGPSFWPQTVINDSTLVCALDPNKLIILSQDQDLSSRIENQQFKDILNGVSVRSNHTIMKIITK